LEPRFPAGTPGCEDGPEESDDLFEVLRAELRQARARAGRLSARPAAESEQSSGLFLPAGFAPPPGLPAPEVKNSAKLPFGPPPGLSPQ
jgi:hypothetical protein